MLKKDKAVLQNFNDASQCEYLETNGLGGWSGSSIIGAHTRRYHGLFVAAINPPTDRMVLLSKLDETIVTKGRDASSGLNRVELSCNLYDGDAIHPNGHHYLNSFTKDLFPQWTYKVEDILLQKTIAMIHCENTVVVIYDVLKAPTAFTLELLPLMAARGYHSLQHAGPQMHWDVNFQNGVFHNKPDGSVNVFINTRLIV
jgi:predicted glycogen debranching enzyme